MIRNIEESVFHTGNPIYQIRTSVIDDLSVVEFEQL